jgi:hypothetical protein
MGEYDYELELAAEELVTNHGRLGWLGGFGVGRALAYLPRILLKEEKVLAIARGIIGFRPWILAVTGFRVILLNQGYVFGYKLLEIPLSSVKMVFHRLGLFFGEIIFSLGDSQTRLGFLSKKNLPAIMTLIAEALNSGAASEAAPDAAILSQAESLSQLERLSALKESGTLTEAEFLAQKKRILSSGRARP